MITKDPAMTHPDPAAVDRHHIPGPGPAAGDMADALAGVAQARAAVDRLRGTTAPPDPANDVIRATLSPAAVRGLGQATSGVRALVDEIDRLTRERDNYRDALRSAAHPPPGHDPAGLARDALRDIEEYVKPDPTEGTAPTEPTDP